MSSVKTFYKLVGGAFIASCTTNFVWYALLWYVYLQTQNTIAPGVISGLYFVILIFTSYFLGKLLDRYKKKTVMLAASLSSLILFSVCLVVLQVLPAGTFATITSPFLWLFSLAILFGSVSGAAYNIAVPTLATVLVPVERRDRVNGLLGMTVAISMGINMAVGGLLLAFGGMMWVLIIGICGTLVTLGYIALLHLPKETVVKKDKDTEEKITLRDTIRIVKSVPGLFALVFFSCFNNIIVGAIYAVSDAYALSLVAIEVWGPLCGVCSIATLFGGFMVNRKGLGKNPLRTLFLANIANSLVLVFWPIQPWLILLVIGTIVFMFLLPFCQASEQTIIQKVVPYEVQGRVFGFAQSIEQSVAPLTAFLTGPITQLIFIPFMTTGAGVGLIGNWFGSGAGRGIGLVLIVTGIMGLIVTLVAMRLNAYKILFKRYSEPEKPIEKDAQTP